MLENRSLPMAQSEKNAKQPEEQPKTKFVGLRGIETYPQPAEEFFPGLEPEPSDSASPNSSSESDGSISAETPPVASKT